MRAGEARRMGTGPRRRVDGAASNPSALDMDKKHARLDMLREEPLLLNFCYGR